MQSSVRVAAVGVWVLLGAVSAVLADDPLGTTYRTGALPPSPSAMTNLPQVGKYRAFLPLSVDLSDRFPDVGDQGTQGSCTAWAVGYAARGYYSGEVDGRDLSAPINLPSPAYIYNLIRPRSGGCDGGSSITDALDLLASHGAASIEAMPYDESRCPAPTSDEQSAATDFRIDGYTGVPTRQLDTVKGLLAKGRPVIVSITAYSGLFDMRGTEIYSEVSGVYEGEHAITLVGYDDTRMAFKFINSWGTGWGDDGFGWISYDFWLEVASYGFTIDSEIEPPPYVPPTPPPMPRPRPPQPEPEPQPQPVPLDDVMPSVSCGATSIKNGSVTGFVGEQSELDAILAFSDENGLINEVELRPWPQCEALLTMAGVLASGDAPEILGQDVERLLTEGDALQFGIRTPSYESFLQISYIQADGSVLNLVQSSMDAMKQYRPNAEVRLGASADGPEFVASAPFGREMLVVVASKSPLFPVSRPSVETDREFLSALRSALILHQNSDLIGATFQSVITSPEVSK